MNRDSFSRAYGIIRPIVYLGLAGALAVSLVGIGQKLREMDKPVDTNIVSLEEIPESVDLWVGQWEKDKITLEIDREGYMEQVNAPRNGFSQWDYKRFGRKTKFLESLADTILTADSGNFHSLISKPYESDDPSEEGLYVSVPSKFWNSDYVRVLDFTRANVKYKTNEDDVGQFPEETLVLGEGDCEDQAFLAGGLLQYGRKVAMVYESDYGAESGHATIAIGRNPGEELPYTIIYDNDKYLAAAQQMLADGRMDPNLPYFQGIEMPLSEPGVVVRRQHPAVIKRDGKEYFLLETTADGFHIKEKLRDTYQFKPLN